MVPRDHWAREVTTLAHIIENGDARFTEGEKRYWLDRLIDAYNEDERRVS